MSVELTKDEIVEIKNYLNEISDILIDNHIKTYDKEKLVSILSENVISCRENYISRWERQQELKNNSEEGNNSKFLDIDFSDKKDKIIKFLKNSHFSDFLPTGKNQLSNIVDTLFYKDLSFNEEEINIFQKSVVENFNKDIEDIYQLAFPQDDFTHNEDFEFNLKIMFTEVLSKVKHKDRAEFIAGVSTFLNEVKDTYLGQLKMEIINNELKNSFNGSTTPEEKLNASNKWFEDFESVLKKSSLNPLNFKFNKDKRSLQLTTASGGVFDVWLAINDTKKNELLEEEISIAENTNSIGEIEKIEEKHIKNLRSVQISASADVGYEIEEDSILRHGMSNILFSLCVADYYTKNKDSYIDVAIEKGVSSFLSTAISDSLKEDFTPSSKIKSEENIVFEKLKNIQTRVNKEPLKYFREFLKTKVEFGSVEAYDDLRTEKQFILTKPIVNMIHNLINYYNHEDSFIMEPKNVFSSFRSNSTKSIFSKPLVLNGSKLDNDDVLILLQHSTLLKSVRNSRTFSDHFSCHLNDMFNHYFKNYSHVKNKKNRKLLKENFKIADIDKELVELFFCSEDSKNNLLELNQRQSTLLSEYVSCVLAEKKEIFSYVDLNRKELFKEVEQAIFDEDTRMIFSTHKHGLKLEVDNEGLQIKKKGLEIEIEGLQVDKTKSSLSKNESSIAEHINDYTFSLFENGDFKNEYLLFLKENGIANVSKLFKSRNETKDLFFGFLSKNKDYVLEGDFKEQIEHYKKERTRLNKSLITDKDFFQDEESPEEKIENTINIEENAYNIYHDSLNKHIEEESLKHYERMSLESDFDFENTKEDFELEKLTSSTESILDTTDEEFAFLSEQISGIQDSLIQSIDKKKKNKRSKNSFKRR